MFLGFDRLPENRFPAVVQFFHRAGSLFNVIEGLGDDWRRVRDHALGDRINLKHRAAAGAGYFEGLGSFGHPAK